jgi:PAS domain S-box-containing protein
MGTASQIRVLHVDDEPSFAEMAATFLEREDDRFVVQTVTSASNGLDRLTQDSFDCIISDYDMPSQNGIEFLEAVREGYPDLPFVLYTGKGSEEVASDAISAGVTDYLQKESGSSQYTVLANRVKNAVEQYRANRELEASQQRRKHQHDALLELSTDDAVASGDFETAVRRITETAADVLNVSRVNVWLLDGREDGDVLRCVDHYCRNTDSHDRGMELIPDEYPSYLEALETHRAIAADDALEDPRTAELAEYLDTHDIGALLDGTLRAEGDVIGMVCHEHVGETRDWTDDERGFASDIAEITHRAIRNHERNERERELKRKERRYDAIFNDPNILVGLLDTEGIVREINQTAMEYVDSSLDDIQGMPFWKTPWFDHSEAVQTDVEEWVSRAANGEYVEFKLDLVAPSGNPYTVEGAFRPVTDEEGEVISILVSGRDVTEQKQQDRQLRQEQEFVKSIFGAIPDLLYAFGIDGYPLRWNDRVETVTGYTSDEIAELSVTEFVPDDEVELIVEQFQTVVEDQDTVTVEFALETKDGDRIPYEFSGAPLIDADGSLRGVTGVGRDISARKERERRYDAIFNQTYQFTGLLEPNGTLIEANDTALEFGGIDRDDVIGEKMWDAYWFQHSEETRARARDAVNRAANGEFVREELPVQGADHEVIIDFSIRPLTDDQGDVDLLIPEGRDITELKEREQQLRELQLQQEAAIEAGAIGTWDWDPQEDVFVTNSELATTFGVDPDVAREGAPLEAFVSAIHDTDRERVKDAIQETLESCGDYHEEFRVWNAADELRWISARGRVECTDDGTPLKFPGVAIDITEQKEREQQLQAREEKLQRQNERLEEFASVISHDLRNPLRVATGSVELAHEECDSDHLDTIETALDRMDRIIEDVLWLAREGRDIGSTEPVTVHELVDSAWEMVAAEVKDAELQNNIPDELAITADDDRLLQLLENLFRNAVEHSGDGVTVTIGMIEDGFYVEDEGPGIPEDDRETVFTAGYSTTEDGTGFGLSIVRQIADAHNWDVRVTDGSEGGARFVFTGVEFAAE